MKNDIFNTLEKNDFSVSEDVEMIASDNAFSLILIPYFNIDKKLGINTKNIDAYVEFQLLYHPFDEKVKVEYGVFGYDFEHKREYIPTNDESTMFVDYIEEQCKNKYEMSGKELYINTYFCSLAEDFELVLEKKREYFQIRNLVDDFVLLKTKDENMEKYVGKEIEPIYIESEKCFGFKCDETDELIYSTKNISENIENEEFEI